MAKRDYYEILGIPKTATQEEIKKAYRKKALENHPDVGGSDEIFQEINEANEVLSDEEAKSNYDRYGHDARPQDSFDFNEFLRRRGFGQHGQQQRQGINITLTVKLTLEEVFTSVNKKYKYNRKQHCSTCQGKGGTNPTPCTKCGGAGVLNYIQNLGPIQIVNTMVCDQCNGDKVKFEEACKTCAGEGVVSIEDFVEFLVPSGAEDNMRMQAAGKGDAVKNGAVGSLIVILMVLPHSTFVRNGNDLKMVVKLTYPQLILGDKIEIPTIEGTKIRVNVPEYTKVGDTLKIKNKGLKDINSDARGDLLVMVELHVPNNISAEERKIVEQLKKVTQKVAN